MTNFIIISLAFMAGAGFAIGMDEIIHAYKQMNWEKLWSWVGREFD